MHSNANGVNVVIVSLYYANKLREEDITILLRDSHFLYLDNENGMDLKHIPLKHLHYLVTKQVFIHSGPLC